MEYLNLVLVHWPFVVAFGFFYVVARALKRGPLSPERAEEVAWVRAVRRWVPLPLHPLAWGIGVGLAPGMPVSPGIEAGGMSAVLYFAGAGVLSVLWHDIYREWQKYRKK